MREHEPTRLTNQASHPRLELGRNFMAAGAPPRETGPTTPETAADKIQATQKLAEARSAAQNLISAMSPEEKEAFKAELFRQEGLNTAGRMEEREEQKERYIKYLTNKKERDRYFDHFFSLVDATPHQFFSEIWNRNLNRVYAYDNFIELIGNAAVGDFESTGIMPADLGLDPNSPEKLEKFREDLNEDLARYQAERTLREHLHDVNAALYLPGLKAKQLYEHMQNFKSEEADLAWRTPGVLQMARIYEEVLREDMAKNEGYLRPESVLGYIDSVQDENGSEVINKVTRGEIETEVRKRFMGMVDSGQVVVKNQRGQAVPLKKGDFEDWKIDKIFTMAKGMSIINLRLISIAAESKLPPLSARYTSLFLQDIIATFSPFVHLEGKFQIGGKAIAPYLFKSEPAKRFLGMFTEWDPTTLNDILKKFEEDGLQAILDSPDFLYIQKLNPNMAGDLFTWLSWRANDDKSVPSMIQRYIMRGEERMQARIVNKIKPAGISEEEYKKEYANWIGTGLNFERLRGRLTKLDPHKSWGENKRILGEKANSKKSFTETQKEAEKRIKDAKEILDAMDKADKLLERMATLQPHRLFLKSEAIRKRLGLSNEAISRIMKNLSLAEETLLRNREELLDQGKTFSTVSLDFSVIPEAERAEAQNFAESLKRDFETNKDKYHEEFVLRREYKHGFVLWDGDAPKDEFNFTALGQPGVARRARDAASQEEAWTEEIKLLDGLEHVHTIEDLVKALEGIHKKVDDYDKEKAQLTTAEKAEAFAQFFAEASFTKVPIFGQIERMFGPNVSVAKIVFGHDAPAWSSLQLKDFFYSLRSKDYITQVDYDRLSNKYATMPDVVADFGVTWVQLVTLALAIYLIQRLLKEK